MMMFSATLSGRREVPAMVQVHVSGSGGPNGHMSVPRTVEIM